MSKEQDKEGLGAKGTEQNLIDKKGNIGVLATNSAKFPNLGSEFLNNKKIQGNETRIFNLGVPESSLGENKSSDTPKYYKDSKGNIREYQGGRELIEIAGNLSKTMEEMQKKYGDKNYPPKVQRELEEQIGQNWGRVTSILDADPAGTALRDAKSPYTQTGPNYADVLDTLKQSYKNLEKISQRLKTEPTIAYGTVSATASIDAIPTDTELKNALSKAIFEQEKITGISFKASDFKTKLEAINPKDLGKIEILIENGTNKQSKEYKISTKDFLNTLKQIDPKSIPNQGVSFHNLSTDQRSEVRRNINGQLENAQLNHGEIIKPDNKKNFPKLNLKNTVESKINAVKPKTPSFTSSPVLTTKKLGEVGKIAFLEDVKKSVEAAKAKDIKALEANELKSVGKSGPVKPSAPLVQEGVKGAQMHAARRAIWEGDARIPKRMIPPKNIEQKAQGAPESLLQKSDSQTNDRSATSEKGNTLPFKSAPPLAMDAKPNVEIPKEEPKAAPPRPNVEAPKPAKSLEEIGYNVLNAIRDRASNLLKKSGIAELYDKVKGGASSFRDDPKATMKAVKNEAKDAVGAVKQEVKETVKANLSEQELESLKNTKQNLKNAVQQVHEAKDAIVGAVKQEIKESVKANLTTQEYDSLKDTKKNLKNAAHQIHEDLKKFLPGKGSESAPKPMPKGKDKGFEK